MIQDSFAKVCPHRLAEMSPAAKRRMLGHKPLYQDAPPVQAVKRPEPERSVAPEAPRATSKGGTVEGILELVSDHTGRDVETIRAPVRSQKSAVAARTATIILAGRAKIPTEEIARCLGMREPSVRQILSGVTRGRRERANRIVKAILERLNGISVEGVRGTDG